jgi:branched-chain amino acid transport system substrate-binding protein
MTHLLRALAPVLVLAGTAAAQTPGVTATEIKVGQTAAYSGPASTYSTISIAEKDYFKMINDQGGINGRKVDLIAYDDGYSPPKTIEDVRRLIEQDRVAILFQTLGTAPNAAIRRYTNSRKVPDIWIGSGASVFVDPKHHPWTIPLQPSYRLEGQMYAKYVLKTKPEAKVGIIYQNDDLGRDYVNGFRDGLGAKADKMIVKTVSYEITDATIDQQILSLQSAGVDVVLDASTPKFSAMSISKMADLNWHPLHIIDSNGALVKPALETAGFKQSTGIISAAYLKDPTDPQWKDDPGVQQFEAWRAKYAPSSDPANPTWAYGYWEAQALVVVLKQAGNDLSRENIMHAATHLPPTTFPILLPGLVASTSPTDYRPIKSLRLQRFDGTKYVLLPK